MGYTNVSQICHFNLSDLKDISGNNIKLDEQTRFFDSLNRIRSQLVLVPSNSLLTSEGYLV
jgi:hypothetical protein